VVEPRPPDEIVQSAVQTEVVADVFSRRALVDPDFMELRGRTAHDQVLSYWIRRTEVRPQMLEHAIETGRGRFYLKLTPEQYRKLRS
jgi:hypothetical protein